MPAILTDGLAVRLLLVGLPSGGDGQVSQPLAELLGYHSPLAAKDHHQQLAGGLDRPKTAPA